MRARWQRIAAIAAIGAALSTAGGTAALCAAPFEGRTGDASAAQVRDLAQRAHRDPAALEALREVDSIDGAQADLRNVLDDIDDKTLASRLGTLASTDNPQTVDGRQARASARDIVDSFNARAERPIGWLERAIDKLREWLSALFEPLQGLLRVPGWLLPVLAIATVAVTALVAWRSARRITLAGVAHGRSAGRHDKPFDPAELERRADEAEHRGDFTEAIRLRFSAGLLHLDGAGVIRYRASMTTREIARMVKSPLFAKLSAAFDEIVYGGRSPRPEDAEASRRDWFALRSETR